MLVIYLPTKFHIHSSDGTFPIAVKMKAKENFCTATMLLFYIL